MGKTTIHSENGSVSRDNKCSDYFSSGRVTLLLLALASLTCLSACKTVKTTQSRSKFAMKKAPGSPAGDASPGSDGDAKKNGDDTQSIVTLKSNPIVDSDFVLAKTMPGMVLSAKAPAFASLTTGNLLIPMCPSSDANCLSPSIYVFNPETNKISHMITPTSLFIPYACDAEARILGIVPDTTKKFASLESDLVTILAGSGTPDIGLPDPALQNAGAILVSSAVVAGAVSGSSDRPIACKYTESLCYLPVSSGCGASTPALRSFTPPESFNSYCKPFPAAKKIMGFTAGNELVFSSPTATENIISFEPLPALETSEPSAAVDMTVNTMKILGAAGNNDPFSFVDDSLQNLFSFSSVGENKSWTVVHMSDKTIIGNVPLQFSMEGRGTYFSVYNGTILEIRPASGANPPAVYTLAADKVYETAQQNPWDDTINE